MPQSLRICHWGKDKGEKWKTGQIEENWILERCPQTAGCRNLPLSAARSSPQSASLCRQLLLPHMSWGHLPWTLPAYLFRQQTLTSFALLCDQSAAKMDVHLIWIFITLQTNAHQKNHIWLTNLLFFHIPFFSHCPQTRQRQLFWYESTVITKELWALLKLIVKK